MMTPTAERGRRHPPPLGAGLGGDLRPAYPRPSNWCILADLEPTDVGARGRYAKWLREAVATEYEALTVWDKGV
jgi:hypothetical protein